MESTTYLCMPGIDVLSVANAALKNKMPVYAISVCMQDISSILQTINAMNVTKIASAV